MTVVTRRVLPSIRSLACLAGLLLLLVPALGMAQQAAGLSAADRADVKAFTFNADVFSRLQNVVKQADAMDLKRGQVDMTQVHSLNDLARQLVASDSRAKPLLAKYGFTPRQFLIANLALVGTVVPLRQATTSEQKQALKAQLNPVNVRFYEAHKAAMEQLVFGADAPGS